MNYEIEITLSIACVIIIFIPLQTVKSTHLHCSKACVDLSHSAVYILYPPSHFFCSLPPSINNTYINISAMCVQHGVSHFTGPISHPSSTGLLERGVQEMINFVSKKCIEKNTNEGWSLMVRECTLAMNTKTVRIHGYTPS